MPKQIEAPNAEQIKEKWFEKGRNLTNTEISNLMNSLEAKENRLKAIQNIASTGALTNSIITKEEKLIEIQNIATY